MNLGKIIVGGITIADGNAIADVVGGDALTANNYTQLINVIITDKQSLVDVLVSYNIPSNMSESYASLIAKLDGISAISDEYKQALIDVLAEYGIPASLDDTFEELIAKLYQIQGTKFRYAEEDFSDTSFLAEPFSDESSVALVDVTQNILGSDFSNTSFLDNMFTDSINIII